MKNENSLKSWLTDMNLNHPLVVGGPCSAETEDQVLKIAHDLKNSDVTVFRAVSYTHLTLPTKA